MNDQQTLFHHFTAVARRRGQKYYEFGRVEVTLLEPRLVQATVRGTQLYTVSIRGDRARGQISMSCACKAFQRFGSCKHLWALVLEVDEAQRELASGRPLPPASRNAVRSERPWAERLRALEKNRTAGRSDLWSASGVDDTKIVYRLDVDTSDARESTVIETVVQRRRLSGEWGSERDFDPRDDRTVRPTNELDLEILRRLTGADTTSEYFGQQSSRSGSEHMLDDALAAELLPLLCSTNRFTWRMRGYDGGALVWDDGPPWRFRAELEERGEQLALVGELVREGEHETRRLALDDAHAVLTSGFVVVDDVLARFDDRGATAMVAELRRNGPVFAPLAEREQLVEALLGLPGELWRSVPDLSASTPSTPTPCLFIEGERSARATLGCQVAFAYGDELVPPEDRREILTSDGRTIRRDLEAERKAARQFTESGIRRPSSDQSWEHHGAIEPKRVPAIASALMDLGWVVHADESRMRKSSGSSASVRSGTDWFDLQGGLEFGGEVAPFPELLKAAKDGRRTIQLDDGSVGLLPEDWLSSWGLLNLGAEEDGGLRFPRQQGWLLDALLAEREGVSVDRGFASYREALAGFEGVRPGTEPAGFVGELRGYQREGFGWFTFLRELGLGGCLADDMGLGKTVQVLALLEERRSPEQASLVVAPRSVVFNWIDEAARFTPNLKVVDYTGPDRRERLAANPDADLLVTTYGTLRRDVIELAERRFDYAILDEAQAIKNSASQTAKAARLIRADHRLALSGTPIENHLGELWSLFEFLNPGMLGRSGVFQKLIRSTDPDSALLARSLRPFFLRRTKEEVLDDLPEKTEQTLHCELGKTERRRYDELRNHYRAELLGRAGRGRSRADEDPRARGAAPPAPVRVPPGPDRPAAPPRELRQARRPDRPPRRDRRRGSQGARLLPVHEAPRHRPRPPRPPRPPLRVPRRPDASAQAPRRSLPVRPGLPVLPHQPEGRRPRPEPDRRRHGLPARPVVEPGRRGPGRRPRPPSGPDPRRLRLPPDRQRHRRGARRRAPGAEARARALDLRRQGRDVAGSDA